MVTVAALSKHSDASHRSANGKSPAANVGRRAYFTPEADPVSAELARLGTVMTALRGRTIIDEDADAEYLFKVVSGALRAVRCLPDGRRYVTKFLLPGDFFGFSEAEHYDQTVEAVSDSSVIRYSRKSFDALLVRDVAVGRRFLGVVCNELCAAQERLLLMGRKSALERLASFLVGVADRMDGVGSRKPSEVHLPMNRSDVADYLGLTVETVSRLLAQLRASRVVEVPSPNHIVFLRRDVLETISAGEH